MDRPQIQTPKSAGADLVAAHDAWVSPGGYTKIATTYTYDLDKPALVKGRSGLAFKEQILAFEGLIDADYRGVVSVLLYSVRQSSNGPSYKIKAGDRVAQLVVLDNVVTGETFDVSPDAQEREGGFGSTGGSRDMAQGSNVSEDKAKYKLEDGQRLRFDPFQRQYYAVDEKTGQATPLRSKGKA